MRRRLLGFILALSATVGCGSSSAPGPDPVKVPEVKVDAGKHADHASEGPHGGALAEWGDHEYHVEFTVDHKTQTATVHILDGNAKVAVPIDSAELTLALKLDPPVTIKLAAKPEAGDPAGRSSRFVGTHAALHVERELAGSVAGKVGGKPYSGTFQEKPHADHPAPATKPTQREADLFLKPGGIYTAADILKNGSVVPSVKFAGLSWSHDDDLKPGDKMCPVTFNKADKQCAWQVNGERYEFCCPPCLEKFVRWAKESPEKVKKPSDYIKK